MRKVANMSQPNTADQCNVQTLSSMLWNILKVFPFIAVANNNCIHFNKGEI